MSNSNNVFFLSVFEAVFTEHNLTTNNLFGVLPVERSFRFLMALSNGNSPGMTTTVTMTMTAGLQSTGSDDSNFGLWMDQRKRRRMESNRESARRSRMRKQMHLDELAATATRLTSENAWLSVGITVVARRWMAMEAENLVLRAQMAELSRQLDSLDDILGWVKLGLAQVPEWFGNCQGWTA